jgi:hypothetical protein
MTLRPSHLLLFSLVRSFTAKSICFHEPVQGSNLNRRSISGLESEMPVTQDGFKLKGTHHFSYANNVNVRDGSVHTVHTV